MRQEARGEKVARWEGKKAKRLKAGVLHAGRKRPLVAEATEINV
jgi:hypothetical protein